MKNILKIFTISVIAMSIITGCSSSKGNHKINEAEKDNLDENTKIEIKVGSLKGPTTMGMVKLMDEAEKGNLENDYNVSMTGTVDEIVTSMVKGELDMAAVPCNLASVLYNKMNGGVSVVAVNTLGVLYMVENGNEINSVEDLKGKTIYSTGKGTTPEYILNYILSENGIDIEKDLTVEYKSEATEVAAILQEDSNAIAMLPQPFVTTVQAKNSNIRIALDMTEEWDKLQGENGSALVTGVVVARKEFLESNKSAVEMYLKDYKESIEYVNINVDEASGLVEKYGIVPAPIAEKAIPLCNIKYIDGDEMKVKVQGYLSVLFNQNPQSIGGKLPEEDFYYEN